jgi:hypothetical protein
MPEEAVLEAPAELEAPADDLGESSEVEQPEGEVSNIGDEIETEGDEEAAEGEEGDTPEETKEEIAADGRKMPDGLKKAIASLKATSPEQAKAIKGLYYSEQAYREVFAKPEEAIAAKTLIEEVGGAEGIQQIHSEREEWQQLDKQYAEGSGDFIKSIAESNPDAFVKMAPQAINEWATRSPEQYGYFANSVAVNTIMQQPGVEAGLQTLSQLHAQLADAPWAQAAIASVVNGIVGLKEKASAFEQKRSSVDPEREKFKQEKTQFETQRRADFEGRVASQAESFLKEKMQPEIDRILAGRKIDDVVMQDYRDKIEAKVQKMMGEIPGFEAKLEAHYRTGDEKKSAEYIQAQYNRLLPEAAKVITPFVKNIAPGKPVPKPGTVATPGKPASAGEVVLKDMPDNSSFDWSKTTVADVIQGHGILKNGKKASGWL